MSDLDLLNDSLGLGKSPQERLGDMALADRNAGITDEGDLQKKYPRTSAMRYHKAEEQQAKVYAAYDAASKAHADAVADFESRVPAESRRQFYDGPTNYDVPGISALRDAVVRTRTEQHSFDRNHQPLLEWQGKETSGTGELFPRISPTFPVSWSESSQAYERSKVEDDYESLGGQSASKGEEKPKTVAPAEGTPPLKAVYGTAESPPWGRSGR